MVYKLMIIISFSTLPLLAHPHVFIDNRISVVFNDKGLAGFRHEWIFDEMFSSTIIREFDLDADGKFNEKEIKGLVKGAFSNLKEYNYFTDIAINGNQFKIKEFKDFHAEIDSGAMIYEFFLPCEVPVSRLIQEVTIAVYDPTYFVQVLWASQKPCAFKNHSKIEFSHEFVEDEKNAYYYGQIIPKALKIMFRQKP
jgi:ABC-type uncharacterized transport system substrate-binding protein